MQHSRSVLCMALFIVVIFMFGGCGVETNGPAGGGGGVGGAIPGSDASLSTLTISAGQLDQLFQSNQLDYTASVGFLARSVNVTATSTDANASIDINGTAVSSGASSPLIPLVSGANNIDIVVTAEDGSTTQTYTLTITRATVASFAQQAYLKASNAEAFDQFGASVAIAGDTLVVGARFEDSTAAGGEANNTASSAGAVYVFTRSGISWSQQAYLKASNAEADDQFGASVAIDGDTIVVGALNEASTAAGGEANNSASGAGAVYVFTRSGLSWSQQAYLKASNAEANDQFGASIAIDGDTVVVGASNEASTAAGGQANNSASGAGAVYVFTRSGLSWSQQAYLKASNAEANDQFGASIAIDGDTVVVGASNEASTAAGGQANNSASGAGAAYVFTRSGLSWSQQAYLKASNAEAFDQFGTSVAIAGDTIVVGALNEASTAAGGEVNNSASGAGAAYVFTRSGLTWSQQAFLKASNAEANDQFGASVAIDGDTVIVGAFNEASTALGGEANNSASAAGAAYTWQ